MIEIESIVAKKDGLPFVIMTWGKEKGQLTPAEARRHALHVLECAEAAEHDAILADVLKEEVGLEIDMTYVLLQSIRRKRQATFGWKTERG